MSVKIRLSRIGRKNLPAFKIVVANTRDKRNGRYLDILGHFNPSNNPVSFDIDKKKYEEWIAKGAQVTTAVKELVDGTYKFVPYTRQNEGNSEEATKEPTDTEPVEVSEEAETKDASTSEALAKEEKAETKEEKPAEEPKVEEKTEEPKEKEEPKEEK